MIKTTPKGSLRNLIRRYLNGREDSYKNGDWMISKGVYDCWFQIYVGKQYIMECIDGELKGISYPLQRDFGMSCEEADAYLLKCLNVVAEEYPNIIVVTDIN